MMTVCLRRRDLVKARQQNTEHDDFAPTKNGTKELNRLRQINMTACLRSKVKALIQQPFDMMTVRLPNDTRKSATAKMTTLCPQQETKPMYRHREKAFLSVQPPLCP